MRIVSQGNRDRVDSGQMFFDHNPTCLGEDVIRNIPLRLRMAELKLAGLVARQVAWNTNMVRVVERL